MSSPNDRHWERENILGYGTLAGRSRTRQCRPLRLSTDTSGCRVPSRSVRYLGGIDTGMVSENVCAAKESKIPLEHVSHRPFCLRGTRSYRTMIALTLYPEVLLQYIHLPNNGSEFRNDMEMSTHDYGTGHNCLAAVKWSKSPRWRGRWVRYSIQRHRQSERRRGKSQIPVFWGLLCVPNVELLHLRQESVFD